MKLKYLYACVYSPEAMFREKSTNSAEMSDAEKEVIAQKIAARMDKKGKIPTDAKIDEDTIFKLATRPQKTSNCI
jgi:hypothetical protein